MFLTRSFVVTALLLAACLIAPMGCSGDESTGKKTLVVGTEPTFPPFEMQDEKGEFTGFDIDLVREIGKRIGREVQIKSMGFDSLIPALQSGQIDMIASGLSITDERKKVIDYSDPYIDAGLVLAVRQNETAIKGSADLKGKTAAVQQGSTGATAAEKLQKDGVLKDVRQFPTVPLAMMELTKGSVDVVINDKPVSEAFVKAQPKDIKLLEQVLEADSYGLAIRKGNTELQQQVNKALAEIKADGTLQQLKDKYFGAAATAAAPSTAPSK